MPTYEYQCQSCGQPTEKFQKMSDEPLLVCPHCKEPQLIQQMSAPAFQLKGTGWYVTDFKDQKNNVPATETKKSVTETTPSITETQSTNTTAEASK
jgi:putative FmdB family regulatory protein